MDPLDKSTESEMSFEEAMKRLENTVARLEKGEVPLEEAMELYTAGMKLAGICSARISEIEARMTILTENSQGGFTEKDFEEEK